MTRTKEKGERVIIKIYIKNITYYNKKYQKKMKKNFHSFCFLCFLPNAPSSCNAWYVTRSNVSMLFKGAGFLLLKRTSKRFWMTRNCCARSFNVDSVSDNLIPATKRKKKNKKRTKKKIRKKIKK